MSRYLSTQERINMAVNAGHAEKVAEYLRMHNSGDGVKSDLESLYVMDNGGGKVIYDKLPPYGVAAVDSYLNVLGIDMVTSNVVQNPVDGIRRPSMAQLAKYAKTAAEDAAVYRGRNRSMYRPEQLIERIASALEYESIDTNFQLLIAVANARGMTNTGLKLEEDKEAGTQTLTLSNGAIVEMHHDTELEEGLQRTYVLAKEGQIPDGCTITRGYLPVVNKLIDELEAEVDRHL